MTLLSMPISCTLNKQCPAGRRRSGSRSRDSPKWQLVEGRYKGNLASQEPRKGEEVGSGIVDIALDGMSSPSSFEELSKARFKVLPPSHVVIVNPTALQCERSFPNPGQFSEIPQKLPIIECAY